MTDIIVKKADHTINGSSLINDTFLVTQKRKKKKKNFNWIQSFI